MDSAPFERLPGLNRPLVRLGVHPCSYLPDRVASNLVDIAPVSSAQYQVLMDNGFRRSGPVFYRPSCPQCRACVALRVPVDRFAQSRSQRRALRKNADVEVQCGPLIADDDRYDLYTRYQRIKHDDAMASDRADFERYFCYSPIDSMEMTFRVGGRLVGVSVVDLTPMSLSSVYFFYDPEESRRSLGVFSALCEIEECRRRGLPYWYLGLHVRGCRKMAYKTDFRPSEFLHPDGIWRAEYPDVG